LEYAKVTEMKFQQMQQQFLPLPEPPVVHPPQSGSNDSTTAAVVEQSSAAPLVTAQNIAIAQE